ncbi:hypothetical protein NW759_014193 [Fusarium solani]|jgi:hypothetical protein|nr:hypothetical protein NW759_014193 [Fusarium solani]
MLLNQFLLGALLALNSVAALPNPDADIHDVEARDDNHGGHHFRCPDDAYPTGNRKRPCVCKDPKEKYDRDFNKCVCKDGFRRKGHKCVCEDRKKEFRDGKCRCRDGMWEDRWGNCRCPKHKHWDDSEQKCKRGHGD